jgi:hypothetical protein
MSIGGTSNSKGNALFCQPRQMGPPVASLDAIFYHASGNCLLSMSRLLLPHALPFALPHIATQCCTLLPMLPLLPMFLPPSQPLFPMPLFVHCCLPFD